MTRIVELYEILQLDRCAAAMHAMRNCGQSIGNGRNKAMAHKLWNNGHVAANLRCPKLWA